ncbi:unnamed protein product [Ambrosiozyma monospora]|uniref:Unnamed protein product n=1 Tax=Ambrosiozyma monospora TaxID=43982 RepID=A0ACB5TL99_AMBMO|nr:unnamed protein product [Ambrosiozyma monospora]
MVNNRKEDECSLQDFCKDIPPELTELILVYAIVEVSKDRNWILGDTLKRTVPQDFALFNWTLHLFRQKPLLYVDVYRSPNSLANCWFGLTSKVVLRMLFQSSTIEKIDIHSDAAFLLSAFLKVLNQC